MLGILFFLVPNLLGPSLFQTLFDVTAGNFNDSISDCIHIRYLLESAEFKSSLFGYMLLVQWRSNNYIHRDTGIGIATFRVVAWSKSSPW